MLKKIDHDARRRDIATAQDGVVERDMHCGQQFVRLLDVDPGRCRPVRGLKKFKPFELSA